MRSPTQSAHEPESDNTLTEIKSAEFRTAVLNSDPPVLVDFWADWCGPCKQMNPILKEAAKNYAGKLKTVKLDVDADGETATEENPSIASQYRIQGIPTMIIFKEGKEVARKVGASSPADLETFLNKNL